MRRLLFGLLGTLVVGSTGCEGILLADAVHSRMQGDARSDAAKREHSQASAARCASAVLPVDMVPPSPAPTLSYDIHSVVKATSTAKTSCERVKDWTRYYRELPKGEKDRLYRLADETKNDGERQYQWQKRADEFAELTRWDSCRTGFPQLPEDPYYELHRQLISYRRNTADEAYAALGVRLSGNPSREDMDRGVEVVRTAQAENISSFKELMECAGASPPRFIATAVHDRETTLAEEARCAATPACVAERKRERIAQLRDFMCEAEGDRQDAKAGIREEWRAAHETGLVDLQNLSDHRTLMEIHEGQIADHAEEWKELTGKAWNAKRVCGQAAR